MSTRFVIYVYYHCSRGLDSLTSVLLGSRRILLSQEILLLFHFGVCLFPVMSSNTSQKCELFQRLPSCVQSKQTRRVSLPFSAGLVSSCSQDSLRTLPQWWVLGLINWPALEACGVSWRGQERKRTEGKVFQRPTHVIDETTVAHGAEVESPQARPLHGWVVIIRGKKEVPGVGLL